MRPVHEKPPGRDRLEAGKARRHPIGRHNGLERQRVGDAFAGGQRRQQPKRSLIRRRAEMDFNAPFPAFLEGSADGVIGIEAFRKIAGKSPGGRLVARDANQCRGAVMHADKLADQRPLFALWGATTIYDPNGH